MKIYKLTEENRNAMIEWLTQGEGKNLSYGSVSTVLTMLSKLEVLKEQNAQSNTKTAGQAENKEPGQSEK